jgi:iron(III) transport system permease protein
MAWLTERTDMPGRTVIRVLMFSWMALPPLVFGYGWILLIKPGQRCPEPRAEGTVRSC